MAKYGQIAERSDLRLTPAVFSHASYYIIFIWSYSYYATHEEDLEDVDRNADLYYIFSQDMFEDGWRIVKYKANADADNDIM